MTNELLERIKLLPMRIELLGGQSYSYVRLEDIIDLFESEPITEEYIMDKLAVYESKYGDVGYSDVTGLLQFGKYLLTNK